MAEYDLFVIGGGSGGVRAARRAAARGARVALAEKSHLGGTCVNVGCVPKKLLYFAAGFSDQWELAESYGRTPNFERFDWQYLIARKNAEIERLNGVYRRLLEDDGVNIIEGKAKLADANTVSIVSGGEEKTMSADKILLASGGTPAVPDIPGRKLAAVSDQLFSLPVLPKSVALVGGGYIALEFACIFAGLGVHTTLCYRADLPLRGLDDDIRRHIAALLPLRGVHIQSGHAPAALAEASDGSKILSFANGDSLTADMVFFVTGRRPTTAGLNVSAADITARDNGTIPVDDAYQTSCPSVFAIGDLLQTPALTPVAIREAEVFVQRNFGGDESAAVDYDNIPTAIFSRPQIATAGLSETAAAARGIEVTAYRAKFRAMKTAFADWPDETLMKLIVRRADERVIGAQMVGEDAAEMMQGMAVAITAGATKRDFDNTVGIHPSSAEEFVTLREEAS